MIQFYDCFTRNEWEQLMFAKEVANGQVVRLEIYNSLSGTTTQYLLSLDDVALNGEGFFVSDRFWTHTKTILSQHFCLEER